MTSFILSSYGLNSTTIIFFYKDDLGIKYPSKVDMPLNKETNQPFCRRISIWEIYDKFGACLEKPQPLKFTLILTNLKIIYKCNTYIHNPDKINFQWFTSWFYISN